jgi:RNA polymerase sigma-70 factor (ECF subfamily)
VQHFQPSGDFIINNSTNPLELTATQPLTALLDACKQGHAASYQALYNRYAKAMYNTCLRIVNHTADAEDILQEAFTDAFSNLGTFKCDAAFGSWLKRIVINKAINKVKRDKKRWLCIDDMPAMQFQEEESIDESEFAWKVDEIKRAIQALPDGYRTILCLHLLENYKHHEIATMLDLSASTVRTQYIRAKSRLLQLVKEEK